ncbi:hypothetical protein LTR08_003791 [Meristemomyces frigidus]|nr:hypothetical protein LTR08_003791 [Meristemomyces frigidus]
MERFHSPPTSRPHTPPYTPQHGKGKRRLDSPAPSIHPAETVSPAKKKAAKRVAAVDNVHVQELSEGDVIAEDVEVVYPHELEEVLSLSSGSDDSDNDDAMSDTDQPSPTYPSSSDFETDGDDTSAGGIARRMSRLHCLDESAEAQFEKGRRLRRMSKRMGSRVFKRTHSETLKNEAGAKGLEVGVEEDARGDQDLSASQRRLRRRVRGPGHDIDTEGVSPGGLGVGGSSGATDDRMWAGGPMTPERDGDGGKTVPLVVEEGSDAMEIDDE